MIVNVEDAKMRPRRSLKSQFASTSNTAKSLGFDILASTRKPLFVRWITTFANRSASCPTPTGLSDPRGSLRLLDRASRYKGLIVDQFRINSSAGYFALDLMQIGRGRRVPVQRPLTARVHMIG